MTESAFLQAILEAPEDDAPRLVYADRLEDHGHAARAEFIRLQCRLAKLPPGDARRPGLAAREGQLLAEHGNAWAGPLLQELGRGATIQRLIVDRVEGPIGGG